MKIDTSSILCFDTETSGLDSKAEICELSIVAFESETVIFHKILKTIDPIPDEVTAIHGITNEMSQDAESIFYYWRYLSKLIENKILIGYNVFYDIRMLFQSYSRWAPNDQVFLNCSGAIDVVRYFDKITGSTKHRKLIDACKFLNINLPEGKFHGATYDSVATLRIFKKLLELEGNLCKCSNG